MPTQLNFKKSAPYLVAGAAVAAAGLWIWSKTRVSIPAGAKPVANFDAARYMGQWYEIARMDYRFERGLQNVTAHYSLKRNGTIKVINRGQDTATGEWKQSKGKAKFVGHNRTGRLKVSFFGPFYAAYNIIAISDDYQHALVAGNDLSYLWLLSRAPEMPDDVRKNFLLQASAIGYNIGRLVWTRQQAAEQVPIATVS